MEQYYRWLSRLYAQEFGRPHMPLVDTIFRYNQRELRGHYLANLFNVIAETRPSAKGRNTGRTPAHSDGNRKDGLRPGKD